MTRYGKHDLFYVIANILEFIYNHIFRLILCHGTLLARRLYMRSMYYCFFNYTVQFIIKL